MTRNNTKDCKLSLSSLTERFKYHSHKSSLGKTFFTMQAVQQWCQLPREVVQSLSFKVLKTQED